jgi:hypothetical protein
MVIVDAIQNLAQLLAKSPASSAVGGERQAAYQMQLTPGQQVQAEVLASMPNQRYLARIAGELFRIELPIIVQPGEIFQMTVVTGEPNLSFTLSRSQNSATPVTISDTGKWLGQLSRNSDDPQQVGSLPRNGLILNDRPGDTALFAGLLRDALTLNGVFYESHLIQWFLGKRSQKELLQEPQGKLSVRGKTAADGKSAQQRVKSDCKGPSGEPDEPILDAILSDDDLNERSGPIDPRTMPIIQEQLQMLHSDRFIWQGQVWPGQQMEWEVSREKQANGEGAEAGCQSILRLDLPNLGQVVATVQLGKGGISIHISADRAAASVAMKSEEQALLQAMTGAGIKVQKMAIEHEEHGKRT